MAHQGKYVFFEIIASDCPKWDPPNPDLADSFGRTDLNFENFDLLYFLDQKFLDFQVPRSPNFWISRSPDLRIPRVPGPQISRFPDAACAGVGRTLRSQLDPSPNAPRDQIHRKGPCYDDSGMMGMMGMSTFEPDRRQAAGLWLCC